MPRKKTAKETAKETTIPIAGMDPDPPANPEGEAVLAALRSNLDLLGELAARYEVDFRPERPAVMPSINSPNDVHNLLGAEMSMLSQEQMRVLLLDIRNNVVAQRVVYQGNISAPRHAA